MWENTNNQRKSQRAAAVLAILIMVGLVIAWPVAGSFGDWINSTNAPDLEDNRYKEQCDWGSPASGASFDMDGSGSIIESGSYRSYYIWENASGDILKSNVTQSAGVCTVTTECNAGNSTGNITNDLSWTTASPYFDLYFDYTAKQAYDDNVVRIRLYLSGITNTHDKAKSITLSAGGVNFYQTTKAASDTDNYIDVNVSINTNDLRQAIINDGGGQTAYFRLKVTGQDNATFSYASSAMYTYNATKLFSRDDALFFVGAITVALTFAGIFLVQPKYAITLGKRSVGKGGF